MSADTTEIVRPAIFKIDADGKTTSVVEPDLAGDGLAALDWAGEQIYFSARRYVAAFEAAEITMKINPHGPSLGDTVQDLQHTHPRRGDP